MNINSQFKITHLVVTHVADTVDAYECLLLVYFITSISCNDVLNTQSTASLKAEAGLNMTFKLSYL